MKKCFLAALVLFSALLSIPAWGGVLRSGDFVMVSTYSGTTYQLVVFDGISWTPSVIATGGFLDAATDIAVTSKGDVLLSVVGVGVVRVVPETAEQSVITTLAALGDGRPSGIVISPDGTIYVSMQGVSPRVVQLSADGAFLRVVTTGGFLPIPAGMCFGSDGAFYVCATSLFGGGGLVRVDVTSGAQTVFAANELLKGPLDVAAAPDGSLWSVQYGMGTFRSAGCVVRTQVTDGYSEVLSMFDCTADGVAVRSDGVALVGDCMRVHSDCYYHYSVVYPSGSRIWDYGGPVAVVPDALVQATTSSWGRIKVLYR
jgi:sugar lactone lactonase YvrE